MVLTFPSFLERKFRLKEVRMAAKGFSARSSLDAKGSPFSSPFLSSRFHCMWFSNYQRFCWGVSQTCPMHGPHALANTVAPVSSRSSVTLSRSIVALICSDPGVQRKGT